MSLTLRVLLTMAALLTIAWILRKIRKLKIKMDDAIFWVFFAGVMFIIGLFPQTIYWLANLVGILSPANLVFLIMFILLFEKVFTLSAQISQLEEKITILSAELALRSHDSVMKSKEKEDKEDKEN